MFKKESIWFLFASICFFLAGAFEFMDRQPVFGFFFSALGFVFLTLKLSNKKKVADFILLEKDEEFLNLISEGKKIEAIKRCRSIVNSGLKEASEYVESIIKLGQ